MQNCRKKIIILLLKIVAIGLCLVFIVKHYFYEMNPFAIFPTFIISFLLLWWINWWTGLLKKDYFKCSRVMGSSNRKWIDIFINPAKDGVLEDDRLFSDMDMPPTILSSMNFDIEGDRLGLGTDLFSDKKTLVETIGLDSLNKEIMNTSRHLVYENYLLQQKNETPQRNQ